MKKQNNIYIVGKRKMPMGFYWFIKNSDKSISQCRCLYYWDGEDIWYYHDSLEKFVSTILPIEGEEFELIRGLA